MKRVRFDLTQVTDGDTRFLGVQNKDLNGTGDGLAGLTDVESVISNDATLGGLSPSTTIAPTQYAIKTYFADFEQAIKFRGTIDCSTNPPYPSAVVGDLYIVSVAGKIGGPSGENVEVGDELICIVNTVGGETGESANWNIIQANKQFGNLTGSGLVSVTNGTGAVVGTGTAINLSGITSLGAANELIGMNESGTELEYKHFVAGSGISITDSTGGAITITNTSGVSDPLTINRVNANIFASQSIGVATSGAIRLATSDIIQFGSNTGNPSITSDGSDIVVTGIKSDAFISSTISPASTGQIRLAKTDTIYFKNNAAADVKALSIDASDYVYSQATFKADTLVSGGNITTATGNITTTSGYVSGSYLIGGSIRSSSSPIADAGTIRLSSTDTISFRNQTNASNRTISLSNDQISVPGLITSGGLWFGTFPLAIAFSLSGAVGSPGTISIPVVASDTLALLSETQNLANKTMQSTCTWNGGAIGTSYGGTGLTSAGSANQILGMNSGASGLEYKTLTQGSGITITHGANSVTIASTVTSIPAEEHFYIAGNLYVANQIQQKVLYSARTFTGVKCQVLVAPVTTAIIIKIQKSSSGSPSWSDVDTLTIAAGQYTTSDTPTGGYVFSAGDIISISITQVGTGTTGSDLMATLI